MCLNSLYKKWLLCIAFLFLLPLQANAGKKEIYLPGTGEIYEVEVTPRQAPAVIYYGGDILTMDSEQPVYAEAVVTQGKKITFVGAKDEAVKKYGSSFKL